jgi:membrane protease YdiL (CAAX protease family)
LFSTTLVKALVSFVAVGAVPLSRELFFRHQLYLRAAAAGHGRRAALVSSAMFALPMILMPVAYLVMFVQGLACCAMYRRTGRLAVPLIVSVVATGLAFLVFWVSPLSMVNIRWNQG